MKDYARSRASVETKTSIASAASELPTWYESETAAIVDISDWEHGSGHSAWSNVAEAELWQSILAKASDDYEALWTGTTGKALMTYVIAPGKSKDTEPKSTVAGSSRLKSAFSTFGKNAFGSNTHFWKEASETKLFQSQNVVSEPTHDFGSNKDFWSETSDTEVFQSEDAESEPSARAPLIAAFIVPGSKAFKVLQELGTDECKLYETVNTSGQKKPAHAIEQEQWS